MARTAILYIAERCNQSCVFCLEEDGQWTEFVDPSTVEVFGHVDRLWDRGARHITFMGGETFFRKDLGRILAHAKGRGFTRVGVTTNGTVLAKEGFLGGLVRSGLDFVEISIHGHTPELANAIGGTHFTFERQALALAEIEKEGILAIVNVVVCRENAAHLLDVARYVVEGHPRMNARFKFKFVSLQGLAASHAASGQKPLAYEEVDIRPAAAWLAARGVPSWFYNFPLCRLGAHAARAHEVGTLSVDESYFDLDHHVNAGYYDSGYQLEGRVWPESPCAPCTLRPICPGLESTYRRAHGEGALATRSDDPVAMVAAALADRGADASAAPARVAALAREPRPSRFVRVRAEGALRLRHADEPEPLDVLVEPADGKPAFFASARVALRYREWDSSGRAFSRPRVAALLRRAAEVLRAAEAEAAALDTVRERVAAAAAQDGWTLEPTSAAAPPTRKKRGALPLVT